MALHACWHTYTSYIYMIVFMSLLVRTHVDSPTQWLRIFFNDIFEL